MRAYHYTLAMLLATSTIAASAACIDPGEDPTDNGGDPADGKEDGVVPGTTMSWKRVSTVKAVPKTALASGRYRVHLIDVGTGLSILVQGADFTMLYDGGSGDDRAGRTGTGRTAKNGNRLLAYLFAALGPSGPIECTPDGDKWPQVDRPKIAIDHLFLSHPHEDHDSLLDDVVHCYDIQEVWDSGDNNNRDGYAKFMVEVAATSNVTYHNAAGRRPGEKLTIFNSLVTLPKNTVTMAQNDEVTLGVGASMELLHVDGRVTQDENLNSTVVRVVLGKTVMLLAGDEEAGARLDPSANAGQIEGALLASQADKLKADIYQVAHHGSSTSNRTVFLDKVLPRIAILSSGPLPYTGLLLPEKPVVDAIKALSSHPVLLRTDLHDSTVATCVADRIGLDDGHPGGCDNYVISAR